MTALLAALTTSILALASPGRVGDSAIAEAEALLASPLGQVASRLVTATRGDEYFRNVFRQITKDLRDGGHITEPQLACVNELEAADYTPALAVALACVHERPVLEHALAFYSSPIGARHLRMVYEKNWRMNQRDFPLPPERPKESMTFTELREVLEFRDSPMTGPFADPRMVTQWDDTRKAAALVARVKMLTCGITGNVLPEQLRPAEPR